MAGDLRRLGEIPERVARIEERTETLVDGQETLRDEFRERLNRVDAAHATAAAQLVKATTPQTFGAKFKDTLAVMLPIILALIAAYATIQAAGGA